MEKQIETTAALDLDQIEFRTLLDVELVLIGGGENVTSLF